MSKSCSTCGKPNRANARFCAHCATPFMQTCTVCGTQNASTARFCHYCASPLTAQLPQVPVGGTGLLIAQTLLNGRYRIIQKVGRGGMGAVYKATDSRLGDKVVAIKEMSEAALTNRFEKQQARDAFEQEAQVLAKLTHTYLPRVTDHFSENGKQYLVMDFINGNTLQDLLDRAGGALDVQQVVEWGQKLCEVLEYLHTQQPPIIFRDLKPPNIMVDHKGRVKLIDFGIVRLFKKGQNTDTISIGTSGYSPPEQHGNGQTDARSDIYALGATLHYLLTNRKPALSPFHFAPLRTLNSQVPLHVEQAIMRAVQRHPDDRWQSVRQMRNALMSADATPPPRQVTPPPATRVQPRANKPQIRPNAPLPPRPDPNGPTRKWPTNKQSSVARPTRQSRQPRQSPPVTPPSRQSRQPRQSPPVAPPTRQSRQPKGPPPSIKKAAPTAPPTRVNHPAPKQLIPAKANAAKATKSVTTKPTKQSKSEPKAAPGRISRFLSAIRSYLLRVTITALVLALAKFILFPLGVLPDPLAAALWWMAGPLAYMLTKRAGAAFLAHGLDNLAYVSLLGSFSPDQLIWLVPGAVIDLIVSRGGYQQRRYQQVIGACLVASVVSIPLLVTSGWPPSLYKLMLQLGGAFLGGTMAYIIGRIVRR
ncbi:MAG: ECF transporter S component [Ardenticatenaceae bacterium]